MSIIIYQQPLPDYLSHPTTLFFFTMRSLFDSLSVRLPAFTTRNTIIGYDLSEAVHLEPLLDHILTTDCNLNRCC
jgi:hypothetical protein